MPATFLVDLAHNTVGGVSVTPQTIASATTTNGAAIDMQLTDGCVQAVVALGLLTDATLTVTVQLQECATSGGTYTNLVTADITSAIAGSTGGVAAQLFFLSTNQRTLRYMRAQVVTAGGGTLSCPISVGIFGQPKIMGTGPGNQL